MNLSLSIETGISKNLSTEFIFQDSCGVIRCKNAIVGIFETYKDGSQTVLETLEILDEHKNKGYGTAFFEVYFSENPKQGSIRGIATDDSVGFYRKLGAEISSSCSRCSVAECPCNDPEYGNFDLSDFEVCDDCSPNEFIIKRNSILKK